MDSRDYVFAFPIDGAAGVPADFEPPPGVNDLLAGLFLPQSEPDSLGRRAYPARILLLTPDGLWVVPHPRAMEQRFFVLLGDLEALECGRFLLLGWIGFRCEDGEQVLRYNRRCSDTVEKFLTRLKACWLSQQVGQTAPELALRGDYGAALNVKFKYALETERIGDEEPPLIRLFLPSVRRFRRRVFRHETWSGGDLILLSQRRVLWITERRGTVCEPYGTISYSAPLAALVEAGYYSAAHEPQLRVCLRSGQIWRLPLDNGNEPDAQSFAAAIQEALRVSRANEPLSMRTESTSTGQQ
jgi:hypothetical protein